MRVFLVTILSARPTDWEWRVVSPYGRVNLFLDPLRQPRLKSSVYQMATGRARLVLGRDCC
jgi:hypothetical protein